MRDADHEHDAPSDGTNWFHLESKKMKLLASPSVMSDGAVEAGKKRRLCL